jgi:hypothetical protein
MHENPTPETASERHERMQRDVLYLLAYKTTDDFVFALSTEPIGRSTRPVLKR